MVLIPAKYPLFPAICLHPSSGPHFCVIGRSNPGSAFRTSTVSYLLAVTPRDWSKGSLASCSAVIPTCLHPQSARLLAPAFSGGRPPARILVADSYFSVGRARQLVCPGADVLCREDAHARGRRRRTCGCLYSRPRLHAGSPRAEIPQVRKSPRPAAQQGCPHGRCSPCSGIGSPCS